VGSAGRVSLRGLERGVEAHLAYQAEALRSVPGFEAEVPVRGERVRGEWRATLAGRCDGVRPAPAGGFVVEELKHVAAARGLRGLLREAAETQAALYAWLLEAERGAACEAELVWLGAHGVSRERARLARGEALGALDAQIDRVTAEALAQVEELARRRAAAPHVTFPFPTPRRGQAQIGEACERALAAREQLLLEAPTGLGKTAAVLTAALRHALANDLQLYVLTSRTLQQRLALETLRRIAPPGMRVAARLRNKSRMCASGELQCHDERCRFARGHRGAVAEHALVARSFDGGVAAPAEVFALAERHGACPYELMAEAARSACAVVADTNYAFDPAVMLAELRDPDRLARAILVIDEAHALPARARDALTARLDAGALRAAIAQIALASGALSQRQRELAEALLAALEDCVAEAVGTDAADACACGDLGGADGARFRDALEQALDDTFDALGGAPVEGPLGAFVALAFEALAYFAAAAEGTHRALAGRAGGVAYLERACIDPAPALGRVLGGAHAVIALSATLSPPEWHARLLGVDAARAAFTRIAGEDLGERLRVVIEPRVATTFEARAAGTKALARRVAAFADAVPGNVLVVGPSFAWLAQLARALEDRGRACALERAGADPRERDAWLATLRDARGVVALAVAGGAFTEGFDSAGLGLSAVAVLGPCLPVPTPRRELERELYEQELGDGFALAYALPGMTRVIQSVGRLLRSDADRGVVALFGERFLRAPYRELLPEAWLAGGSPEALVGDPARVARAFFASERGTD
jgi:DNA excision repair protein ERCC-2